MMIRQAKYSDLEILKKIFDGAKQIMRSSGNLHQWNNGYPSEDIILKDISKGHCYVLCQDNEILAKMALIQGPDPTYSFIEGEWTDNRPYYVIHRIATASPGRGIAKLMFDWAFEHISKSGYEVIRIDTHKDNCIMKHILSKYGFTMCGVIYLESGDPRDAYHYCKGTTA